MSVKIREKRGKLYLDIYHKGVRKWEALNLTLPKDKTQQREVLRLAEIVRLKKEAELLSGKYEIETAANPKSSLFAFMEGYKKNHKRSNVIQACIKHIKDFAGSDVVLFSEVNQKWVEAFHDYLLQHEKLSRNSAAYYSRILYTILNSAESKEIILKNPAKKIKKLKTIEPELPYLTFEELQAMVKVDFENEYAREVKRAFLFGCYTGLRVSDLETLTWDMIEKTHDGKWQIKKRQEKTQETAIIPLKGSAYRLIEDIRGKGKVFKVLGLRSRRASYAHLERWGKLAGIDKKIGWHTARRTFGTLTLTYGAQLSTVAKLLGHSSLKQVAKYAKVVDEVKQKAIDALPDI